MERAEEILKQKLDVKIAILNNPNYTFNKVIEAMEQYADERAIKFAEWINDKISKEITFLFSDGTYYYESKITTISELLEIFKNQPTN